MPSFAIVTDSTADFPLDSPLAGASHPTVVAVVPLVVNWGGASYEDKQQLSTAAFYERLASRKDLPQTSAPSRGAFLKVFQNLLAEHAGVLAITLATEVSSTYENARQAAAGLDPARIRVVESGTVSMPLAWLVQAAGELAGAGVPLEDAERQVQLLKPRVRLFAALETLEFLKRGGRIGRAQALAGTILSVKPILEVRDGEVRPVARVRTKVGAMQRLSEIAGALGPLDRLGVIHGAAPESAAELGARLSKDFQETRIENGEIGSVVGVHAGPGAFGFVALLRG